ncbi:hypothetical protein [Parasphaerochaeta coccoides]|uniref:Lipoprotein n=1 Tax=Parasphaerochaeta coccoides (strain ATCC BAA-1237 / DSM 17374 / SPN1) TaxID=760011 RepID=F4GL17_PARC1|nr:hypothetical protein [Parasphaerochaeta coccoides]AEC02357.1 hypothetical protein Spico_1139 [Parasphaerochaeta coccoides DSM 17374]
MKRKPYAFITLSLVLLTFLASCTLEFRQKIVLVISIYHPSDKSEPPLGSKEKPLSITVGYDADTIIDAVKDIDIVINYTIAASEQRTIEEFMLSGNVHSLYLDSGNPNRAIFLYQDEYGESYFSIYFLTKMSLIGDITEWKDPPAVGNGQDML